MLLENNGAGVRIQNLITIGAKYSIVEDGVGVLAEDNLNVNSHPKWSQISIFESTSKEIIWIDPAIWNSPNPTIACKPPCILKMPPWKGATSTINYPIVTASGDGGWTTKVTRQPITVTEWLVESVTIQADGKQVAARGVEARATDGDLVGTIWPTFATTPVWPYVVYAGVDALLTTTRPVSPTHPGPPPPAGPTPPPTPPTGSWPNAVVVRWGEPSPKVDNCWYEDPLCHDGYFDWEWQATFDIPVGDEDPEEQNPEDEGVMCPTSTESSTSSTTTTTSATTTKDTPTATEPTLPEPSPSANEVECYDSGAKADHIQLDGGINSVCSGYDGKTLDGPFFKEFTKPQNVYNNQVLDIVLSINVLDGCQWKVTMDSCRRYFNVPVDSCNCAKVDSKQGGVMKNNCLELRVDPNIHW